MAGLRSSLDPLETVTSAAIKVQMMAADDKMAALLATIDLATPIANGQAGHEIVFQMIKHRCTIMAS